MKTQMLIGIALTFTLSSCGKGDSSGEDTLTDSEFVVDATSDGITTASSLTEDFMSSLNSGETSGSGASTLAAITPGLFQRTDTDCPKISREQIDDSTFVVTRTFDSCTRGGLLFPNRRVTLDGVAKFTISRENESGTVFNRTVVVDRDLSITNASGAVLSIQADKTHVITTSDSMIRDELTVRSVHRVRKNAAGKTVRDYTLSGSITYEGAVSNGSVTEAVANGSIQIVQNLADRVVALTLTDVTWTAECAQPVSGTIRRTATLSDGSTREATIEFSGCGSYSDGESSARELSED